MNEPADYSQKPLLEKLGYQTGDNIFLVNAPEWFIKLLSSGGIDKAISFPAEWAHGFFKSREELALFLDSIDFDGIRKGVWVSWPKKTSGIKTDLTDQVFRDLILPLGWVDTKVVAIDPTWTGIKFLRRKA